MAHMAYVCTQSVTECIPTDAVAAPEEGLFQPLCVWEGPGCAGHCWGTRECHSPPSCLCLAICQEQGESFWHPVLLFPTPCPLLPYRSCLPWRCLLDISTPIGSYEVCLTTGWPLEPTSQVYFLDFLFNPLCPSITVTHCLQKNWMPPGMNSFVETSVSTINLQMLWWWQNPGMKILSHNCSLFIGQI